MDEVIRDVDPVAGAAKRFRTQYVSLVEVEALALERAGAGAAAVAHQASHVVRPAGQPGGEEASDEPGRAGNKHVSAHVAAARLMGAENWAVRAFAEAGERRIADRENASLEERIGDPERALQREGRRRR